MRFRLRTLMILLAVLPPMIAGVWFASRQYQAWKQRDIAGPGFIGRSYIDEDGNWVFRIVNGETGEEVSVQENESPGQPSN